MNTFCFTLATVRPSKNGLFITDRWSGSYKDGIFLYGVIVEQDDYEPNGWEIGGWRIPFELTKTPRPEVHCPDLKERRTVHRLFRKPRPVPGDIGFYSTHLEWRQGRVWEDYRLVWYGTVQISMTEGTTYVS